MERGSLKGRIVFWYIGIALGMIVAALLSGCQVDVSGGVGAKAFYPDRFGETHYLGDPRRPMYDGSGYVEGHGAGGQSEFQGFKKMGGEQ